VLECLAQDRKLLDASLSHAGLTITSPISLGLRKKCLGFLTFLFR